MSDTSRNVTFLFTDIEGSTQLWERHPAEMQAALARHDQLVRSAIESNSGYVFKTIGDAFCASFETSDHAVSAALSAQRAIAAEKWPEEVPIKVRMAVHSGPVEARENDFFGQTVNRVARILSAGHGGQTLVSQGSIDVFSSDTQDGVSFKDLGEHRLKDLSRPERIYQLLHSELRDSFPALRSLESSAAPNNLPAQITSFVGRAADLEKVTTLLAKSRVVTLTGAGGCGKTRLALQAAVDVFERFKDGVWIVELASLVEAETVTQAVANLVGVRQEPGQSVLQALSFHLRTKRVLLILDNCEHLIEASAELVVKILASCPNVSILATSREPLNVAGEATYRVPSLASPDPRKHKTKAALEAFDSVLLFAERAQAISADFQITDANASSLARLCEQLDGIPLAIELAAARVRSMTIEQIADRLDDRFRLLTGGSRTALPRQQTLRALVDWSYELLQDPEKALLRRLSAFAGGCSLEATEFVTAGDPIEEWEVLDLMTSLIDKSLVSFDPANGIDRYRLLETVKRYGRDKLAEVGESTWVSERHVSWFTKLARDAGSFVRSPSQRLWVERLDAEYDNLWLALQTSQERKDWRSAAQLGWTLGTLLQFRGQLSEAVKAIEIGIESLVGHDDADPMVAARLEYERAGIHQDFGESDSALELATRARTQFELSDEPIWAARAENLIGQIHMSLAHYAEAEAKFIGSLTSFESANDQIGVSIVLNNLGVLARRKTADAPEQRANHLEEAQVRLAQALSIRRSLGDLTGEAETLNNLGVVCFESADYDAAWKHYCDSLAIERELGHPSGVATTLANLGEVAGIRGDHRLAVQLLAASQKILADIGSPLAGAVQSMLGDLSDEVTEEFIDGVVEQTTTGSADDFVQEFLLGNLATTSRKS